MRICAYTFYRYFLFAIALLLMSDASAAGDKKNFLNMPSLDRQSQFPVTGVVTSASGDLLAGVTVQVKNNPLATTTGSKGSYELNASGSDTLVFSYVGYVTQEVPVNGRSNVNVVLSVSSSELSQVVVVGYGTQRKENLTAAVDIVDTKQIASRGNGNVTEMLQGVSPNLNITPGSTTAGEPGGKPSINIRGIGTLTGDYAPYVLVDGVPMDINAVNSSDIQSITVLKDAAAAAIYGSKGAFGVILITTRSGSRKKKIQIGYSNNISFSNPIGRPHMENSLKYITAFDQASINAGLGANFTQENYDRIEKYMAGEIKEETWLMPDSSDWMGNGIWSIAGNGNNDWMYIFYKDITTRQKHNIDISGGGDKTSYYVSAGLWDQPDELRYGGQFYKRYNVTANITSKATDWMTFKFNSKYINERNRYFNTKEGYDRNTFYHDFYRTNSFRPRVLPNGEFSDISDIPPLVDGGKIDVYGSQYILSLGAILEPVKNWETVISYNYTNSNSRYDDNKKTVYGTDPRGQKYVHAYPTSSYASNFVADNNTLFNITSSYNLELDKHNFYVMAGFESQSDLLNGITGSKNNILTSSVPSISTSTGTINLSDNKSHWASESFFGRFRYNYREKYLLEINGRYDGSSRFASDSRWGFFPSVSLGYNISQESFWEAFKPYVNTFKIRGSWGSLGNQQVPNYLYLPTIGMGTNLNWIVGSVRPDFVLAPALTSADLTWETITTKNIGLDAGFLDGRLSASFDLYTRITSDMFGPAEALPLTLGTSVPQTNNATIKTRGFDLDLTWRDHIGANVTYSVRATVSDNVTTVLEYNNPTKSLSTWYKGQTLGEIWGLRTVGIYQSEEEAGKGPDQTLFYPTWGAGDIQYKDLDGDDKITRGSGTADDPGDYTIIGNNSSRYPVGLYGELRWKNIDFSMFWQGVLKREYAFARANDNAFYGFNGEQWWGMNAFYKGNNTTLDYWRPEDETNILGPNTGAYYPKPYLSTEDYKNKEIQTRYMQKASYFRLKSLTIGYTVPSDLTRRVAVENARIYVSGENLLTFTPLTKLVDPEALFNAGWGVAKGHFLRRIFSVGINVTFK